MNIIIWLLALMGVKQPTRKQPTPEQAAEMERKQLGYLKIKT